jgi:hypothetical protein
MQGTFVGDAVDVGRFITHHAPAVGADISDADVVAPNHQDVGIFVCRERLTSSQYEHDHEYESHKQSCFSHCFSPLLILIALRAVCCYCRCSFYQKLDQTWGKIMTEIHVRSFCEIDVERKKRAAILD